MRGRKKRQDYYEWGWYPRSSKPAIEAGTGIRGGGKYGATWWGQQWLEAFEQISDANRLPRGRTYANNGSVRSIDLEGNVIHAKVQGSYLYKVEITIPAFSPQQQKQIEGLVVENPDLLARLLNRELPSELADLCLSKGIRIFPQNWHSFKASCSCPDWAMPCKHLAAVIYLIANEIDKNPFLVFSLHQFDLPAALEAAGYAGAETQAVRATKLDDLRLSQDDVSEGSFQFDPALLDSVDFSRIPECRDNLPAIVSERPVFYPSGDFKAVLKKVWTNLSKKITAYDEQRRIETLAETWVYENAGIIEIHIDPFYRFLSFSVWDEDNNILFQTVKLEEAEKWLSGIPAGRLSELPDELRAVWLAWRFARALAVNSAIVPQLLNGGESGYAIRWLPALLNEEVADAFRKLSALLPTWQIVIQSPQGEMAPTTEDYPQALLSVFLTAWVNEYNGLDYLSLENLINKVFFGGKPTFFDTFETREYPSAIVLWLNRFFITEKNIVPVLEVREKADELFGVNLSLEDKSAPMATPTPLSEIFISEKWHQKRLEVLRDLSLLADFFPALRRLLADKGSKDLVYEARDFAEVLLQTLPVIRLFGIRVMLPKSLSRILRPQLSMRMNSQGGKVSSKKGISLAEMLQYQWQIAIGEHDLTAEEFLELLKKSKGLVKIRDEYVFIDEKETRALAEKLARPPVLKGPELLQIALSEDYQGVRVVLSKELQDLIQELKSVDLTPLPAGIHATLRPYQHRGYSWLCKNARIGFGSILADDMGLGKTLQVITALQYFKENGDLHADHRALIVAPTTLLTNWQREVTRFAPGLQTFIYHGAGRSLTDAKNADLVLTSYGVARSDQTKLEKQKWLALVIDEAQNIKNPDTEQSKAVKKIPAIIRIALSGTPVENRLSEYWSVFDFTNKGYLGGLKYFKEQYAIPIEGERNKSVLRRFHRVTQPFVLRRLKTDKTIITDLPLKVEQNQYCSLTAEQAALYQGVVDQTMEKIEKSEGIARRGLILNLIMALKQICNHPAQYLKKGLPDPDQSGKCPLLLDLLDQAFENDGKVLIFTQFREMGELLIPMLHKRFGIEAPFLHGGVSRKNRDVMVEDFQNKRSHRLLLLSLKAGGTGLNLTAANQVIHYDLWWNPAVEAQATDRAFRIGQQRNVQVHRFITSATFEERIDAMIQAKKELADLTVTSGETWIGQLSDGELRNLFKLG